ncbi:MAG TPA: CHAT domain-containing protein [Thermoanaerobaculia bacterium]
MAEPKLMTCPDAEAIAAFAEGRLTEAARAEIVSHLDECEECVTELTLAMAAVRRDPGTAVASRRWRWLAVAAVVAVVAGLSWWLAMPRDRGDLETLIAVAPRSARSVEARLSGFPWATYRGAARQDAPAVDAERMKLVGVAGELVTRAKNEPNAEAQHAAGVAMVLIENPLAAAAFLENAARAANDARSWSDLAAARYAAAEDLQRPSLYPEALAAADRALQIEPALPEALFNRALILERLRLTGEARRMWTHYLEIDGTSPWATEARARLQALPATTTTLEFEKERPRLERAAAAGDREVVRSVVSRYPERARALAETEWLGMWGEAVQRGDSAAADAILTLARMVGEALTARTGEALLHESVAAIDAAAEPRRTEIAGGLARYLQARMRYARHEPAVARTELLRAAEALDAARHPMALSARFYAASARLASAEVRGARAELEQVRDRLAAHPGFLSLAGQTRWELGRAHLLDAKPTTAIPILAEGASLLRRAGERTREAFVESILASALASAGRGDESWGAQIRAFEALSAEGIAERLEASIAGAVRTELIAGRRDSALALARLNRSVERPDARVLDVLDALLQRALLETADGNPAEALRAAREAEKLAARATDPAQRARLAADAAFALGAAQSLREPRSATASLTTAIDYYREHGLTLALPEPLLLRARCALARGDPGSAAGDLEAGIVAIEAARGSDDATAAEKGPLQAGRTLFEEAVRLALTRGDPAGAFALAERLQGGTISVEALQERLAGSGVVVLEVVVLPGELVTFAVSDEDFAVHRRAWLGGEVTYEDVIRPAEAIVGAARSVIVVPDPLLETTPFAALFDRERQKYLVERVPVAIAPSAAVLERTPVRHRPRSLAAIGLASGGAAGTRGLPAVDGELADIVPLYVRRSRALAATARYADLRAAGADVIHIAGHTRRQPGAGEQALLFGAGEWITWRDIAAGTVDAEVVVLAACETLRSPASQSTRAPSLGAAFVGAGARDVVGTLAEIADRDARALFFALHRELAAGGDAATALRHVQIDAIRRGGDAPWRNTAVLTRRIPVAAGDGTRGNDASRAR